MSPDSKDIKFPTQHYIGFQTRPDQDGVPLGFMTPDGTDAAAVKRKATVDQWAKGYGYSAKNEGALPAKTLENKPMNGFKLGRSLRHGGGWGQGNVKWRIEDPRGFELEITSPNLAKIMACTTIENGEILEQCMWARLKSDNVLVPVTSDVYKAAQSNTERLSKSASMSDLKLGDYAILHNGEEGTYLGSYILGYDGFGRYGGADQVRFEDKKKHLFMQEDNAIYIVATPKLSEIKPAETPFTPVEAERKVLDHIRASGKFNFAGSNYGSGPDFVTTVGGKSVMKVSRSAEKVNAADYISKTAKDASVLLVSTNAGDWGAVRTEYLNGSRSSWHRYDFTMTAMKKEVFFITGNFEPVQTAAPRYWGGSGLQPKQVEVMLTDVVLEAHRVRIKATTALGNEIDYIA